MKAVTTLCLVWLLVGSAGAVKCKVGNTDVECQEQELCATIRVSGPGKTQSTEKKCLSQPLCDTMKQKAVIIQQNDTVTVQCCDKEKCDDVAPGPETKAQSRTCKFCDGEDAKTCKDITCANGLDRCWNRTEAQKSIASGCVTSNTCSLKEDDRKKLNGQLGTIKGFETLQCHSSAMSLKLSVALSVLWLGVGAFVVS